MSSTRAPDFSRLAAAYDVVRPVDANWWAVYGVVEQLVDLRGRRVLDVGCGTGRLSVALAERAGAKVWGVDASPEMLAIARAKAPRGVAFKEARAESLPFKDAWFERVVLWLVVHLVERSAAFAEARRVLSAGGRIAVVSFDPSHFDAYWLNEYLPSLEQIDRARFPTGDELVSELSTAGFVDLEVARVDQRAELSRDDALLRLRERHISTLQLIEPDEYERGVAEAERRLPAEVAYDVNWLVVTGTAA
jgi:ubiquinone/menaquinone biosynthesis C-methylase UbiE